MSSEKARRWTLRGADAGPRPFTHVYNGPELGWEEKVEVAEVSALRAEWEKEQLEAMRSPWTVALVADRLKERNGESLSDEERVRLARAIVTDLTSPQVLIKEERDRG